MSKRIALVGATGAVGQLVRQILSERSVEMDSIKFIASARSAGKKIRFNEVEHTIHELKPDVFTDVDIVIGSTPDDTALEFAPWVVEAGAVLVDESGAHRMLPEVPLVVPEVNASEIANHKGIIASPNCSTTQMVVALKPLHDFARVKRVIVSTYQATSGAGQAGQQELVNSIQAALNDTNFDNQTFSHPIAFNVIPHIGSEKHQGYTSEEMKMVWETQKIFGDNTIEVCPTCVRVPVSNCHSESIVVETEKPVSLDKAKELFDSASGITVNDNLTASQYPMPCNADNLDDVFVGRIREDISSGNGLAFWCVSDNLRKGAATNAVQIAEILLANK
ncbi:MAG: aspartate-semialdehyde dehydrogenase [Planctomycetota bacterium]